MTGTLSIVATPIGNLEDITLRALRVLKEADAVFAEDTRVTKKLLTYYDIHTPVYRLDAHTEDRGAEEVFERLQKGEHLAYVSDAGTPGISDPGARLVQKIRHAVSNFGHEMLDIRVEAIPGPSSLTAALSIAGVSTDEFVFLGFLPHKKGRQTLLKEIEETERTVVLFESTHRIIKLLSELEGLIAHGRVCIARELTKIHEEVLCGSPAELKSTLEKSPVKQKGEFVVIIAREK